MPDIHLTLCYVLILLAANFDKFVPASKFNFDFASDFAHIWAKLTMAVLQSYRN